MEEFEACEIVARVVEGEVPNLKHSCTPSTYKGVGQQVKIKTASVMYVDRGNGGALCFSI